MKSDHATVHVAAGPGVVIIAASTWEAKQIAAALRDRTQRVGGDEYSRTELLKLADRIEEASSSESQPDSATDTR